MGDGEANWRLVRGKVERWAAHYRGEKFHALLCDPPYHLTEPRSGGSGSGQAWAQRSESAKAARRGGFMGKAWDGGDVAFDPDVWVALSEHLLPGAFGMAFASSRGWHRLAVAIEDAGLVIHPSIFGWAYGSGFPKATRIDTAVDKAAGAERETFKRTGGRYDYGFSDEAKAALGPVVQEYSKGFQGDPTIGSIPATPLAQAWQGHRYGLQALKPALEPIIVFQKCYEGRPVDSITRHGAGALWIDGGRIGAGNARPERTSLGDLPSQGIYQDGLHGSRATGETVEGRWPANFYLSHSPDCERVGVREVRNASGSVTGDEPSAPAQNVYGEMRRVSFVRHGGEDGVEIVEQWQCVADCPVRRLGEQSGASASSQGVPRAGLAGAGWGMSATGAEYSDEGTAARFFHNASWQLEVEEVVAAADPVRYEAKAGRWERDAGLAHLPLEVASNAIDRASQRVGDEGAAPGGSRSGPRHNPHPTVKPIALAQWLATLLLPPAAYAPRRLLVPFAGAGSEMIGALLAGWECIVGVEMELGYVDIARARLRWWERWEREQVNPVVEIVSEGEKLTLTQLDLLGALGVE